MPKTPEKSLRRAVLAAMRGPGGDNKEGAGKAPVTTLLLAARAARAIGSVRNAAAMGRPHAITVLLLPGTEDRTCFQRDAGRVMSGFASAAGVPEQDRRALLCLRRDPDESRRRSGRDEFGHSADGAVALGKPVVLVVPDLADLPASVVSLGYSAYTIDALSPDDLTAVLAAEFPDNPAVPPARFSGTPEALFRLPGPAYQAAFRLDTAEAVAARLIECAERAAAPRPTYTLEDLHLAPDLRDVLDAILVDLEDHRAGRVGWQDVPASVLLYGPPGCGKTSIARALAGSAGLNFVSASYAECQAAGTLQYYLRAMEDRVEQAIAGAPALFFIDELDSFPRRDADHGRNDSYITAVVNHLLEVLSRLSRTPGVVVVGATNFPDKIDPALVRAGRFDTHIHVGPPARSGIEAILRGKLGAASDALDLTGIVRDLTGCTGAEIETVARKARATARRARRALTLDDLAAAMRAHVRLLDPDSLHRVAIHEAGHAVAQAALPSMPVPERAVLSARDAHVESESFALLTQERASDMLVLRLAGRVAERVLLGAVTSGAGTDLRQATALSIEMETRFGLTDGAPVCRPYLPECPWQWPADLHRSVEARLKAADARAAEIVTRHAPTVLRVAEALSEERDLDKARLDALLAPVRNMPAAGNAQRESGDLSETPDPPLA